MNDAIIVSHINNNSTTPNYSRVNDILPSFTNGNFTYLINNYAYTIFTSNGTFLFKEDTPCELLIVGAGGRGGISSGIGGAGGGGAGEIIYYPSLTINGGLYNVQIGIDNPDINQRISKIIKNSDETDLIIANGGGDGGFWNGSTFDSVVRRFPPKNFNSVSPVVSITGGFKTSIILDTTDISYGSGTYEIAYSSKDIDETNDTNAYLLFNSSNTTTSFQKNQYFTTTTSPISYLYKGSKYLAEFTYKGDWVSIKLPIPISLTSYSFVQTLNYEGGAPNNYKIYGSMDGINWTVIKERYATVSLSYTSYVYTDNELPQNLPPYIYYGLVVRSLNNNLGYLIFDDWIIYGKQVIITNATSGGSGGGSSMYSLNNGASFGTPFDISFSKLSNGFNSSYQIQGGNGGSSIFIESFTGTNIQVGSGGTGGTFTSSPINKINYGDGGDGNGGLGYQGLLIIKYPYPYFNTSITPYKFPTSQFFKMSGLNLTNPDGIYFKLLQNQKDNRMISIQDLDIYISSNPILMSSSKSNFNFQKGLYLNSNSTINIGTSNVYSNSNYLINISNSLNIGGDFIISKINSNISLSNLSGFFGIGNENPMNFFDISGNLILPTSRISIYNSNFQPQLSNLDVFGDCRISGDTTTCNLIMNGMILKSDLSPFIDSGWTNTNDRKLNIYNLNANVGIGTTLPRFENRLDINGKIACDEIDVGGSTIDAIYIATSGTSVDTIVMGTLNLNVGGTGSNSFTSNQIINSTMIWSNDYLSNVSNLIVNSNLNISNNVICSNIGIGTTNIGNQNIDIRGIGEYGMRIGNAFMNKDINNDFRIISPNGNVFINKNSLTYLSSGFVGIGSSVPQQSLDLRGDLNVRGLMNMNGGNMSNLVVLNGITMNLSNISIENSGVINKRDGNPFYLTRWTSNLNISYVSGAVGIGSTNQLSNLDVIGNVGIRGVLNGCNSNISNVVFLNGVVLNTSNINITNDFISYKNNTNFIGSRWNVGTNNSITYTSGFVGIRDANSTSTSNHLVIGGNTNVMGFLNMNNSNISNINWFRGRTLKLNNLRFLTNANSIVSFLNGQTFNVNNWMLGDANKYYYSKGNVGLKTSNGQSNALDVIGDIGISRNISNLRQRTFNFSNWNSTGITLTTAVTLQNNSVNNSYGYYQFTANNSITFNRPYYCDVLLVGAGGNGGTGAYSGGGGAGEVIYYPNYLFNTGTYNLTIGTSSTNVNSRITKIMNGTVEILKALGGGNGGNFINKIINTTTNNYILYANTILTYNYTDTSNISVGTYNFTFSNGSITVGSLATNKSYPILKNNSGNIINPIAWYKFDVDELTSDSSGNSFTLVNGYNVTNNTSNFVKGNSSAILNGTDNFYYGRGSNWGLNGIDFTVAFWSYRTSNNLNMSLFQFGNVANLGQRLICYYQSDNKLNWGLFGKENPSTNAYDDANSWVHLGFAFNHTNKTIKYYYNGILIDTITTANVTTNFDANIWIGYTSAFDRHNGSIDDFRIYKLELNDTQMSELYNGRVEFNELLPSYQGGSGGGSYWNSNNQSLTTSNKWNSSYSYVSSGLNGTTTQGGSGGSSPITKESITGTAQTIAVGGAGATASSVASSVSTYGSGGNAGVSSGGSGASGVIIIRLVKEIRNFNLGKNYLLSRGVYNYPTLTINPFIWYKFDDATNLGRDDMNIHNLVNNNSVSINLNDFIRGSGSGSFNGTNQFLSKDSAFNLNSQSFSISLWVKRTANNRDDFFIELGTGYSANTTITCGYRFTNVITLANYNDDLNSVAYASDAGNWVHLCFTYLTGTKRARIYRNGIRIGEKNFGSEFSTNNNIRIGKLNTSYFQGLLDDLRIYQVELTSNQVQELYEGSRINLINYGNTFSRGLVHINSMIDNQSLVSYYNLSSNSGLSNIVFSSIGSNFNNPFLMISNINQNLNSNNNSLNLLSYTNNACNSILLSSEFNIGTGQITMSGNNSNMMIMNSNIINVSNYLDIKGRSGSTVQGGAYITTTTGVVTETYNTALVNYSLRTSSNIICGKNSYALSDVRIKGDLLEMGEDEMGKFLGLRSKRYRMVEDGGNGSNVYGFIAQEVKEDIPEAIELMERYVPDIFKLVKIDMNRIVMDEEDMGRVFKGDKIRIYTKEEEYEVEIEDVDEDRNEIIINREIKDEDIFIYGRKVNDFQVIDKSYIYTLNVFATQRIGKILRELEEKACKLLPA